MSVHRIEVNMLNVYDYLEYRLFMKDYYNTQKSKNPNFSYEIFARKANVASRGFLLHVIKGERNLTRPVLLKVGKAMGLSSQEIEYFELLVFYDQAKNLSEKEFNLNKILSYRKSVKVKNLDESHYAYFSEWYHAVIREILDMTDSQISPSKLGALITPPVTSTQVKESIKLMLELGIITKNSEGKYTLTQKFIHAKTKTMQKIAIANYQKKLCLLSSEVWDRCSENKFSMNTVTLSVHPSLLPQIADEIQSCKNKILELVNSQKENPSIVYTLLLNLFPVTQEIKEKL